MRVRRKSFARKVVVGVIGATTVLIGAIVFPLPLPFGIILVPMGMLILATEFVLARRWLRVIERRTGPVGRNIGAMRSRAQRYANQVMNGGRADRNRRDAA